MSSSLPDSGFPQNTAAGDLLKRESRPLLPYLAAGAGAIACHFIFFAGLGFFPKQAPAPQGNIKSPVMKVELSAPSGENGLPDQPEWPEAGVPSASEEQVLPDPAASFEEPPPPRTETEIPVWETTENPFFSDAALPSLSEIPSDPQPVSRPRASRKNTGTASSKPGGARNTGAGTGVENGQGGGAGAASPRYRYNSRPPYPSSARQSGHEGTVTVRIRLNEEGRPEWTSVVRSSGFPELDQSALEHIRANWRFYPAEKYGKPISWTVEVPVVFSLKNN